MKIYIAATRSYEELEAIEAPKTTLDLTGRWRKIWQKLAKWIVTNDEIQIWQRSKSGQTVWYVHDRKIDRSTCFSSENEVRIWLEQRYCR